MLVAGVFASSRYEIHKIAFKLSYFNFCIIHLIGVIFSVFCGVISSVSYHALFSFVLRRMSKCFTYGEVAVVVQGFVIFLANLYFKLAVIMAIPTDCMGNGSEMCSLESHNNSWTQNVLQYSEMEQLCTILQVFVSIRDRQT